MKRRIYSPGDWVEEPVSYDRSSSSSLPTESITLGTYTFSYTGSLQSIYIPNAPGYRVRISAWGAAGASGFPEYGARLLGGMGGYAEATYTIGTNMTPGNHWVAVGKGGAINTATISPFGGGGCRPQSELGLSGRIVVPSEVSCGGDFSGVGFGSTVSQASSLVIAGGGGGISRNAYQDGGMYGGGGGGTTGLTAYDGVDGTYYASFYVAYTATYNGAGGSQSAGGARSTSDTSTTMALASTAGSAMQGGRIGIGSYTATHLYYLYMAGGGGGYFGGGAGAIGGGGGSSYTSIAGINMPATHSNINSFGNLFRPGNHADPRKPATVGVAKNTGDFAGGNGYVIIDFLAPV